jgi:hypothetical protein
MGEERMFIRWGRSLSSRARASGAKGGREKVGRSVRELIIKSHRLVSSYSMSRISVTWRRLFSYWDWDVKHASRCGWIIGSRRVATDAELAQCVILRGGLRV